MTPSHLKVRLHYIIYLRLSDQSCLQEKRDGVLPASQRTHLVRPEARWILYAYYRIGAGQSDTLRRGSHSFSRPLHRGGIREGRARDGTISLQSKLRLAEQSLACSLRWIL
jgi:hypothetical protein